MRVKSKLFLVSRKIDGMKIKGGNITSQINFTYQYFGLHDLNECRGETAAKFSKP